MYFMIKIEYNFQIYMFKVQEIFQIQFIIKKIKEDFNNFE
jgi:hypothetical protein